MMGMKKGQGISKTTSLTAAERITRMREARKMYSKISQDRSKKPSPENVAPSEGKMPNSIVKNEQSILPTNMRDNNSCTMSAYKMKRDENDLCGIMTSAGRKKNSAILNSVTNVEFKSMKSSLDMIRNNNIRITGSGRASSIAKPKTLPVRPSLLPLGINVFEANHRDQQKVRDFLADRDRTSTPHNSKPEGEISLSDSIAPCSSRVRNVRFRMEEAIQEQQESSGDESLLTPASTSLKPNFVHAEVTKPVLSTEYLIEDCANTPRRESVPKRGILFGGVGSSFDLNKMCCENMKDEISIESSGDNVSNIKQQLEDTDRFNLKTVSFTQCYSFLHQITRQEWRMVEPIMVDEVIELLKEVKENILKDAALQDDESATKLASPMPIMKQDKADEGKHFGFRQFIKKSRLGDDLMANQEVMLINQRATINANTSGDGKRRSLRLRQKNPVATTLGGDSVCPFVPIVSVPSDQSVQISNGESTDEETFAPAGYSFAGRPPLSSSTPRPPHVVRSLFEDSVEDGG
uniref:FH2 domain-containing protein n=1 Tax=Heterorhabditis bacteriophora TaxID=37862 RepID=A0A1I7XMG5_HETBA